MILSLLSSAISADAVGESHIVQANGLDILVQYEDQRYAMTPLGTGTFTGETFNAIKERLDLARFDLTGGAKQAD